MSPWTNHRLRRRGTVVLLLVLALGACARSEPSGPETGLARFYDQKLSFGACEGYATTAADTRAFAGDPGFRCARVEVPLDYDNPGGRTAKIALLKVPARGERIGSLLLNPGGPGGPGMSMAALGAKTLANSAVTERFDLIGFDPRGVGASTPAVDCFTDADLDRGKAVSSVTVGDGTWTEKDTRGLADRCAAGSGGPDVLAHLGTRDAARDLDILRAVLSDEKLSYFGQSYGTRLGAVYAEMFPRNVRAMVLDGGIDPHTGTSERRLSQFASFQRSFDTMAADCATRPGCPLGADPAKATETFQNIVRPLIDHPVPAGGGRELDFNGAWGSVGAGLYDATAWPAVTRGIAEVAAGRGDTLLALSDAFGGRDPDGHWSNFGEANYAINCMDEDRHTPEQESDLKRRVQEAAPYTDSGRGFAGARDGCEAWPARPTLGYPYATGIQGLPQTLTISVTGDPATPYQGGLNLAQALGGAALAVEGEQHTVALAGKSACVNEAVAEYLVALRIPPAGARCTL
ncbi:pimeloyl-ACP methyl ester carboxylesterase [Nocardia transvalensis]|uniref:Pimeloyl-ACP methyl ester carboxylesterase n=1 Tax=Nocardia transvalensis TaxID=37333 RepID=A0A7W9UGJ6_9NOCA|nr:alpha/beta fold hydrolase [Nocardia transvalensis]MBB5912227.1 pimeloyl-ACP methyl ester carboxylesterase [Nocardia transvalensis]